MKYLEILLSKVDHIISNSSDPMISRETFDKAQKELDALKAAGISVEIETVERVKVIKTKHRGRKAKKENA